MKKLKGLIILFVLQACSAPLTSLDLENIKIVDALAKATPKPVISPNPQPTVIKSAQPAPSITPAPTTAPYSLPEETKKGVLDALDASQALYSRTVSGISYNDYPGKVADLQVAIDRMKRQPDYLRHPASRFILQSADDFQFANKLWGCYIDGVLNPGSSIGVNAHEFIQYPCGGKEALALKYKVYPERVGMQDLFYLTGALQAIWKTAKTRLDQAQGEINKPPLSESDASAPLYPPTPTPEPYKFSPTPTPSVS